MAERCPYAVRRPGSVSLLCEKQTGRYPICGHQHLCPQTGKWENTAIAARCPLREANSEYLEGMI